MRWDDGDGDDWANVLCLAGPTHDEGVAEHRMNDITENRYEGRCTGRERER
jgi:hypothetical protein